VTTTSRNLITPRKLWQPWEIDLVTELYPHVETSVIAWFCDCSPSAVYSRAGALGLKKDRATVAQVARERMTPDHPGRAHQFTKGQVPFNKGLKGINYPGSVPTQFKPGQKPHSWAPIGTERISKGGYMQRKVSDTGYRRRDWIAVHILVWQEHTGQQLPKGHAVVFRDRDVKNLDPANLECITRAELMARNTIHRYPKPLKHAIRLVKKLQRTVNEKQK
jgi:hypothetical protein